VQIAFRPMASTSVSLLDRLSDNGDSADWQRLLTIYRPFIASIVRKYPSLESQVDDVVQEVMLVLVRELREFKRHREGSFRTWIRGITVNQLRNALRKSKRFLQTQAYPEEESQLSQLEDPNSDLSLRWDKQHDEWVIQQVMEVVKPRVEPATWNAFHLQAVAKKPPQQVADELGMSLNSVFLAKSRVMKRLRLEAAGLVDI